VLLAWATAHRLALNHGAPPTVVPYVAGFAVAFGLAFAGGLATADDRAPSDRVGGLEPCGTARIVTDLMTGRMPDVDLEGLTVR